MISKILNKQGAILISFCILTILISGCNEVLIKKYVRPNADYTKIKNIAVLPFENYTSDRYADEKIKSLVIIDLLSRGIEVIEPGEVLRILRELKLRSLSSLSEEDIQTVGKILKVDAVIVGSVGSFEIRKGISVASPEVTINMMMHDAISGSVIWSVWHTSGGASFWTRHFGVENATLGNTSKKVVKEAMDTLFLIP